MYKACQEQDVAVQTDVQITDLVASMHIKAHTTQTEHATAII